MALDLQAPVAACPDCEQEIIFTVRPWKGQQITCPYCAADLRISALNPLELDWAYPQVGRQTCFYNSVCADRPKRFWEYLC
jgi:hypothetical protein